MSTTEPIRSKHQVNELTKFYSRKGQTRNHLLIIMALHTALRISDLLRLHWDDVYDFKRSAARETVHLTEKKTGKTKVLSLNKRVTEAVAALFAQNHATPGKSVFINQRTGKAISRIQAYRIVRSASEALEFQHIASCHSLRKTFGYHSWKEGVSPVVIMDIYNHSSFDVTRRYLGITQDEKNEVYLNLDFSV
ncbi:MAG: tyrosine-type recombinase/integrase [Gracilibacteraceae bacterium]|jgi:integrase|nr:tyrosine-type recombinase/integrase [Gracilibacteraceae bacterium]